MRVIDNSGSGSCMYYAYAISLMYHFKSLGHGHAHIKEIFDLLNLDEQEREALTGLLAKPGFFSQKDIRVIEITLEPKLREVVANELINDFVNNPTGSSLFSAVAYKFKEQVKAKIKQSHADLATQIETPDNPRVIRDYNEAEIYRVPGIHKAIDACTTKLAEEIAAEIAILKQADQSEDNDQTKTSKAIDDFFLKKIVDFFTQNEREYLSAYSKRLKDPRSWGTEEALNALHGVITASRPLEIEGYWEEHVGRPINFKNFNNGRPAALYSADENPDMILDNWGNCHWVSQIPAKKDLQILLNDKPGDETITAILDLSNDIDVLLKTYLQKVLPLSITAAKDKTQEKRLKTCLAINTAALKEKLLGELLKQIAKGNPIDLQQNYAYKQLQECKKTFQYITDDTHSQAKKINCLKNYEDQAKSNPTGWEIFGLVIKNFILTSLSTVLGTFIGAAIGGVLGSAAGPGGSIVGAIWGAFKGGNLAVLTGAGSGVIFGSTLGMLQMLQPNMVQDYAEQAKEAVEKSLQYRAVKQSEVVQPPVPVGVQQSDVQKDNSQSVLPHETVDTDETPGSLNFNQRL